MSSSHVLFPTSATPAVPDYPTFIMHQLQETGDPKDEEELQDADALADTRATRPSRKCAQKRLSDDLSNSSSSSIANTVTRRNGRGRRTAGTLSEFINMPFDIFFEVAAYLHPLDTLNLTTRTSKSFRSILLAKNNRSAWVASLAPVDALPSYPGNMSEPLYVALLFDHYYCFALGYSEADFPDGHAWTKLMSQPKLFTNRSALLTTHPSVIPP
ncbi:hypothetical protein GSI_03191 [Ganoderma sinense ZZ0214-1]|uniref:F-box domain-containing protein n=1 Tax=Ganoderma sinense ZZ0214-1 TaxID=1077348 RepID=A0A2G8SKW9_9APHY|nr:hypothetical protein GSI_03191 [Ganoderma sinense ZZ0214-1]